MRELRFIVTGQVIIADPVCDFSGLVPGTKGYLKAVFVFSSEWNGCRKAAVFKSLLNEYPVPICGNTCEIPEEAIKRNSFFVSVVGENDNYRITTNRVEVMQNG